MFCLLFLSHIFTLGSHIISSEEQKYLEFRAGKTRQYAE